MADRHLIIAGQGRAGSTLFYNMLRYSLKGFHMPRSEARAVTLLGTPGNVCTKRPFDIFEMPDILRAAAGRKRVDLIVTLRDPRDILTSRHSRVPDDYFYGADLCYFIPPTGKPELRAPGFLPVHKAILEVAGSGLFPQGIFFLKYEDLVDYPDDVQRLLAEQMDLKFEGSFQDFHRQDISSDLESAMNGVRVLDVSRKEKWKAPEHRERIIEQFTRFPVLHDILISLGYEKDRRWFEDLVAQPAAVPETAVSGSIGEGDGTEPTAGEAPIPAVGSIIDHPAIPTLYEDETLKITHLPGEGDHCVLTFIGVGHGLGGIDQQSEEFRKLGPQWGPQVFIFDKRRSWGNAIDVDRIAEVTAPLREGRTVISMGLSMGGFLAILASSRLGARRCISFAPQFSVHPDIAPFDPRWNGYTSEITEWRAPSLEGCFSPACQYYAFFPDHPVENRHLALFPRLPNLHYFRIGHGDHNVAGVLKEAGLLYPALRAAILGAGPDEMPFRCREVEGVWQADLDPASPVPAAQAG